MTENTDTTNTPYPCCKVILCFALFGGAIGGVLPTLPFFGLFFLPVAVLSGTKYGCIPALLCGVFLAWRTVHSDRIGYAVSVGAVSALLCTLLYDCLIAKVEELLLCSFFMTASGAFAAFRLALFVLPDRIPSNPQTLEIH